MLDPVESDENVPAIVLRNSKLALYIDVNLCTSQPDWSAYVRRLLSFCAIAYRGRDYLKECTLNEGLVLDYVKEQRPLSRVWK